MIIIMIMIITLTRVNITCSMGPEGGAADAGECDQRAGAGEPV